jgi:Fe-S oxidoreductase
MVELLSYKKFYDEPLKKDEPVSEEITKDCYTVFACRHKFCREVCPVYQELRNESYTSYGFHAALLSVSRGIESLGNMKETITYCLECGACELRCPNTLFGGDFYKRRTTTVDLVRKIRRDLIAENEKPNNWGEVEKKIDQYKKYYNSSPEEIRQWAKDLEIPTTGDTILFVDYFTAFQETVTVRTAAQILMKAGVKFGVIERPGLTLGELYETNFDEWLAHAKETIEALKSAGAKTVIVVNPHEYVYLTREYPKYMGSLPFNVIFITEYVAKLIENKKIKLTTEVDIKATYHDPCALNKFSGIWESPRKIIESIPGLEYTDEDPVSQWYNCCGNGIASFKELHPELSYRIGTSRLRKAADLGVQYLLLGCPHCKDQLSEVQTKSKINVEPIHLLEIVAKAMGLEV